MILTKRNALTLALVIVGLCLVAMPVSAASQVAKVTRFTGEVFVQTGTTAVPVNRVGLAIMDGDRIQTRDGEVDLVFSDGAVMKIRPYSSSMIQEQEEESGFWLFKTKKLVRRLTAFVGKMYFKSGSSKRENYLQTPTAVCALRGSEADFGFDNVDSLLNLITGALEDFQGADWTQGAFAAPGQQAAAENAVHRAMQNALAQIQQAAASGSPEDLENAKGEVATLLDTVAGVLEQMPGDVGKAKAAGMRKNARLLRGDTEDGAGAPDGDGGVELPTTTAATTTSTTTTILVEPEEDGDETSTVATTIVAPVTSTIMSTMVPTTSVHTTVVTTISMF